MIHMMATVMVMMKMMIMMMMMTPMDMTAASLVLTWMLQLRP